MKRTFRRLRLVLYALGWSYDRGDWLIPGQVLGCGYPKKDAALASLAEQQVGALVNLHERAHDARRLARLGMREVHVPLRDFAAPTPEQIERAVGAIEASVRAGERVAVHCGGGIGRTGTILACYLVSGGMGSREAIERVRQLRPGSVETRGQVAAIEAYARHVRSR